MPQLPRSSFRDSGRRRSLFDSDAVVWVQPCAEPTAGRANAARVIGGGNISHTRISSAATQTQQKW